MAERRMFAKSVMLYGVVPELSHCAQALYVQLNMHADDDGLIPNPKVLVRLSRCQNRHLQELLDRDLLIPFESGAVAVKHWRVHNQLRKDRHKDTSCQLEWAQLEILPGGIYRLRSGDTSGNQPETQVRVVQSSVAQPSSVQSISEQDKEKADAERASSIPPPADSNLPLSDFEKSVFEMYQRVCPSLQKYNYLGLDNRKRLKELQAIGWTVEMLEEVFTRAEDTPFLRGINSKGWVANLDWLLEDDNLRKILDGRYDGCVAPAQVISGCTALGSAELDAIHRLIST